MPHRRPSIERQSYICIKLHQDTHAAWVKLKTYFKLNSDNVLACYLLSSSGTMSNYHFG